MLSAFRADPAKNPLKTPRAGSRSFGEDRSFGYDDCPGHAVWLEPAEWLRLKEAERYPLTCCRTNRPTSCTANSTQPACARDPKIKGRPAGHDASPTMRPPAASPTATCCACSTTRRQLAAAKLSDRIRRGVVRLSTGAWFDPEDTGSNRRWRSTGNPNALTLDIGASS